jgi:predicted anti-sigma-YlaC factor YlaD
MNCFEVRNEFVAFWQSSLDGDSRAQLLAHLQQCSNCDGSFRTFALTAPVLYSAFEPELNSSSQGSPAAVFNEPGRPRSGYQRPSRSWTRAVAAFVMAAAAVIAFYFAAAQPVTFEDAIAADSVSSELAEYPPTESLFGQEIIAQSTTSRDPVDE